MSNIVLCGRGELAKSCLFNLIEKQQQVSVVGVGNDNSLYHNGIRHLGNDINSLPFNPDIVFSILYDKRIKQEVLENSLCVNLHLSPLPKYAGVYPFYWAIRNGEKEHGVTLHEMELTFDTGKIISQRHFPIIESDTAFSLSKKSYIIAQQMFRDTLDSILTHTYKTRTQDVSQRSYYGKDSVDFKIPLHLKEMTERNAHNIIRASRYPPHSNPSVLINGNSYEILESKREYIKIPRTYFIRENQVLLKTIDGCLQLNVKRIL